MSLNNVPNEGENVGSLLRLVYSCSDNNIESNYNINAGFPSLNGGPPSNPNLMENQHLPKAGQNHYSPLNYHPHHHHPAATNGHLAAGLANEYNILDANDL